MLKNMFELCLVQLRKQGVDKVPTANNNFVRLILFGNWVGPEKDLEKALTTNVVRCNDDLGL